MSLINSTAIPSGAGYEIEQSLRFKDTAKNGTGSFLSFTPPNNNGNKDAWTYSVWAKGLPAPNAKSCQSQMLLSASGGTGHQCYIMLSNDGTFDFRQFHDSEGYHFRKISTALYRDPSAWYHYVVTYDADNSSAEERIKMYVNGVRITSFGTNANPSSGRDSYINGSGLHAIGRNAYSGVAQTDGSIDGYIAEAHFIDGIGGLTPSSFGETGDYGEWKPIEYSGNYGDLGWYLPFKQDYTVEGFSAVTYKGNQTAGHYIGGVGFQSDLVWLKSRTTTNNHSIQDSVRGVDFTIYPNLETEQGTNSRLSSFDSDGFTLTAHGHGNGDFNAVAWNWDMDAGTRTKLGIDVQGTIKHVTAQSKVPSSSSSIYAPSGNANYLQIGESGDIDFGGDNFTIEFWVKDGSGIFFSGYDGAHSVYFSKTGTSTGSIYIATSAAANPANITSITWANWNHIAVVRVNNVFTAYVNGSSQGTATLSGTIASNAFRIGRNGTDSADGSGYFDEIRISNTARYTGNFTAPTAAFADDENTLVLIHSQAANNSTSIVDGGAVNTSGSINTTVRANPSYGQSIVKYTGTAGVSNATKIGHGLSAAPEMIIIKVLGQAEYWPVWHHEMHADGGFDRKMYLNDNAGVTGTDQRRVTSVSSTTFGLCEGASTGGYSEANQIGEEHIAYVFHSVTGYSKFGSYTGNGNATGTTVTTGFRPAFVMIKVSDRGDGGNGGWFMYDNTRDPNTGDRSAHNHVLIANSSSVELVDNSNVAIDFLSNGFQLKASYDEVNVNNGKYIYMAFADTREFAYWLDQSGNNNDWTSNNLTESDISVDSPTNNFATFNPLWWQSSKVSADMSEGNLSYGKNGTDWSYTTGTQIIPKDIKIYFEVRAIDANAYVGVALANENSNAYNAGSRPDGGYVKGLLSMYTDTNTAAIVYRATTGGTALGTQTFNGSNFNNAVIGVAVDQANSNVKFFINGTQITSQSPTNVFDVNLDYVPIVAGSNTVEQTINFGQDSSFAGTETSQGNQDANGIGDFYYAPPTGYLALCTKNLSEPSVVPNEHFAVVPYNGNGAATGSITDDVKNFPPDLVWIKQRSQAGSHILGSRLIGDGKYLSTDSDAIEVSDVEKFRAFTGNGFQIGTHDDVSEAGQTYVAWNWKAGGSGASNTNGSINTTKTSANVDAGFSMMTYTGTNSVRTIGHGLSKAPEMWAVKARSNVSDNQWFVCHKGFASDYYTDFIHFDTNGAKQDSGSRWGDTAPTASVITIGGSSTNVSGGDYVAYAWHSVEGYSKVGSYTGNGNADGAFVHTGFRPAWVMLKTTAITESWYIWDTGRSTFNLMDDILNPDSTNAESVNADRSIDSLSNGFKLRGTNTATNGNGDTYIYLAFAESPFKYSNAR